MVAKLPTSIPSISQFVDEQLRFPRSQPSSPGHLIAYWLRRDIVRGVFVPNERLKLELLTRFYDSGHTPVREAILFLAAGGLVVHEHQKGHRVAPVSLADYRDTLDIYGRIRRLALTMAMERGDDVWEEKVIVQLHRSKKVPHVLPGDDHEGRERWQRAYGDFYDTLTSGCGSPLLIEFYGDLVARAERYINLFADQSSDQLRDHAAEHTEVVEAMIARDAGRLIKVLDETNARAKPMRDSTMAALKKLDASPSTSSS
jgi:GntR family carbon starvation induced transcriptional regulator